MGKIESVERALFGVYGDIAGRVLVECWGRGVGVVVTM